MSQAEDLLNAMAMEEASSHSHSVRDPDKHFVIDPDTRQMSNISGARNVLMQYDHNSEVYTFELPRYIEDHDMLNCNRVRLHYINVGANRKYADVVEMTDLAVNPQNTDSAISTWTIRREATQIAGTLNFLIQYMCVDDAGEVVYEWHTDIYTEVDIKAGMNNSEQAVLEYSNILEDWYQQLFGLEDSVIASISEASEEQKAAIEVKGEEVLASIPEDYTTTYNMANSALRTRANAIVIEAEGETIVANDCSDDYLRGLRLYGKTTQFTTTGAQLIPYPYKNTSNANGEVVWVENADRSVSVTGTPTVQRWYALALDITLPVGTYTFSGCPADGEFNKYWMYVQRKSDGYVWREYGSGATFEVTEEGLYDVVANVGYLAGELTDLTFYPMVNSGTEVKPFEAYSEGMVSPSPDYPQELTSVENPTVSITGKNMLCYPYKETTKTSNGVTFTDNGDGSITIDGTATATTFFQLAELPKFNGLVSISGCPVDGSYATYQLTVDKDGASFINEYGEGKLVLCTAENTYSLAITVRKDTVASNLTFYPCVELGGETTSYESPKIESAITVPYTLRGVPVTSDGNYTDANGQQWICDEIDFERGVYVQRIDTITLDGSDIISYIKNNDTDNDTNYLYYFLLNHSKVPGLCDKLLAKTIGTMNTVNGNALEHLGFSTNAHDSAVYFNIGYYLSENTVNGVKEFLTTNPLTITYVLATPIETALTDEELFNFSQLHSNHPTTTILNDSNVKMEVKYNTDTKSYVDCRSVSEDQIASAVSKYLTENPVSGETLTDSETGKSYQLSVVNGKLTLVSLEV